MVNNSEVCGRGDELGVRRQMFVLHRTRLSQLAQVHLLSALSNGRKRFIIYSSEVKSTDKSVNTYLFLFYFFKG